MTFPLRYVPRDEPWSAPTLDSLEPLFSDLLVSGHAGNTPPGKLWVSMPVGLGFPFFMSVTPSQPLIDFIGENGIYGNELATLDRHYYLQVVSRKEGGWLVVLKYQQILGSYWLALVSRELIHDFFSPRG